MDPALSWQHGRWLGTTSRLFRAKAIADEDDDAVHPQGRDGKAWPRCYVAGPTKMI